MSTTEVRVQDAFDCRLLHRRRPPPRRRTPGDKNLNEKEN